MELKIKERNEIKEIILYEIRKNNQFIANKLLSYINKNQNKTQEYINNLVLQAQENLENTAKEIFESGEFIEQFQKKMFRTITQEINTQIKNTDLHELIGKLLKSKYKNMLKETIKEVVKEVVKQTNNNLTREHRLTKELIYSIDSELKHFLMKLPISYKSEIQIKQKIMATLKEKSKNIQIDFKENKKD